MTLYYYTYYSIVILRACYFFSFRLPGGEIRLGSWSSPLAPVWSQDEIANVRGGGGGGGRGDCEHENDGRSRPLPTPLPLTNNCSYHGGGWI